MQLLLLPDFEIGMNLIIFVLKRYKNQNLVNFRNLNTLSLNINLNTLQIFRIEFICIQDRYTIV